MNPARRPFIAGNWKMNAGGRGARPLAAAVARSAQACDRVDVLVAPPFTALGLVADEVASAGGRVWIAAQNMSHEGAGAFTGEISAPMVREFGCRYAIVGHSERRAYHAESDQLVADKAKAALARGVTPIVCVGETLAEREAGKTEEVVKRQLAAVIHENGCCITEIVLAYEPVWAIGTGKTATPSEAQAVHAVLRTQLKAATDKAPAIRILYGGSMNAANAAQLLAQPDIDGGLVGGASLKAADFLQIIAAAQ